MTIIKLEENFYLYHIKADIKNQLGQNIYVLIDNKEALLINAGYKKYVALVLEDLNSKGIKATKVLPSHYHPDHVEGIYGLDKPVVYGNKHAVETLKRMYKEEDVRILKPTVIIDDDFILEFGNFKLTFEHAPGHSDCSMLITINDKYLHLGDLYIKTDSDEDVLPYVAWKGVKDHIESLDKILVQKNKIFLIAHGVCPVEFEDLRIGIDDRKEYLNALIRSNNHISKEDAVKNCSRQFSFMKWRNSVK